MKKIIYNQYGDFSKLQEVDAEGFSPSRDDVIVKVKAVAINPLDWKLLEGQLKFITGKKFPRSIGFEFSGTVEEIGNSIHKFKVGDQVFGMLDAFQGGALAEFLSVKESFLARIPEGLSFEESAAVSVGGLSAIQLIDDLSHMKKGDEVLINGATGGVGVFAIQIAKIRGATVTSVVSNRGVELAKLLGSDFVVDYSKEDFLKSKKRYDVIIDLSNKVSYNKIKFLLNHKGVFANANPKPVDMVVGVIHNIFSSKKRRILTMKYNPSQMEEICSHIKNGMKVIVGTKFNFNDFREAYVETKKSGTIGKAIIRL
jgi:NADPH:quinone reductase-like Zn-dependent oxidoreductase